MRYAAMIFFGVIIFAFCTAMPYLAEFLMVLNVGFFAFFSKKKSLKKIDKFFVFLFVMFLASIIIAGTGISFVLFCTLVIFMAFFTVINIFRFVALRG